MDTCLGCASLAAMITALGCCQGTMPPANSSPLSGLSVQPGTCGCPRTLKTAPAKRPCPQLVPGVTGWWLGTGPGQTWGDTAHASGWPCWLGDTSLSHLCGSSPVNRAVWPGCASASWQHVARSALRAASSACRGGTLLLPGHSCATSGCRMWQPCHTLGATLAALLQRGTPRCRYSTLREGRPLLSCLRTDLGKAFYLMSLPARGLPFCLFFHAVDLVRASTPSQGCSCSGEGWGSSAP